MKATRILENPPSVSFRHINELNLDQRQLTVNVNTKLRRLKDLVSIRMLQKKLRDKVLDYKNFELVCKTFEVS